MIDSRFKLYAPVPALLALVAACGIASPDAEPAATLLDTAWELTAIDGQPVVAAGPAPTLAVDADGRVSGDAGCNRYFGSVEADDGAAAFSGLGASRRACPDARRMAQEARFLEALGTIAAYRGAGSDRLVLLSADGRPRLAFRAREPALPVTLVFDCDSGRQLTVEQRAVEAVELVLDDAPVRLARVPSASGVRYEAPGVVFFMKGDEALLERGGETERCAMRADSGGAPD